MTAAMHLIMAKVPTSDWVKNIVMGMQYFSYELNNF